MMTDIPDTQKWVIGGIVAVGVVVSGFFLTQIVSINRELGSLSTKSDGIDARLVRIEDKLDQLILKADASADILGDISKSLASVDAESSKAFAAGVPGWTAVTNGAEVKSAIMGSDDSNFLIFKPNNPAQ